MAKKKISKATKVAEPTAAPAAPAADDLPPPPPPIDDSVAEAPAEGSTETCYVFVKNYVPHGEIEFEDETKFTFPKNPFHTTDAEQAEKIRAVAKRYKIIEEPPEEV